MLKETPPSLTVEELGALGVAVLHLLALVGGRLHVAVCGGEHRRPRLHQELAELDVVAGRGAVEGGPGRQVGTGQSDRSLRSGSPPTTAGGAGSDSPAVAVRSVGVDAVLDQKLDDLGVAGADGVVQRRDALVVGHAGVVHLQDRRGENRQTQRRPPVVGGAAVLKHFVPKLQLLERPLEVASGSKKDPKERDRVLTS